MRIKISIYTALILFVFIQNASTSLPVAVATQTGKVEINTKNKVTLKEKIITISDISVVIGDDDELVDRINNIEIGRTPWPNNTRRIDTDILKMRLMALNINLSDIIFNGPKVIKIAVYSTKITGTEIAQIAKEYLMSVLPLNDRETTIELDRMPIDQWVPRKRNEISLDVSLVDTNKDRGNIQLIVSAASNGTRFFKIPVIFKVRVFEYVVVAKRKIARNKRLSSENILLTRRETTKLRGFTFYNIEDLTGEVAKRTILPNTIITEDLVESPPAILKGNIIKLVLKSDGFKIVTKGLAQQTGYTGDVIKVKSLGSNKLLYGKIVDPENVQIVF